MKFTIYDKGLGQGYLGVKGDRVVPVGQEINKAMLFSMDSVKRYQINIYEENLSVNYYTAEQLSVRGLQLFDVDQLLIEKDASNQRNFQKSQQQATKSFEIARTIIASIYQHEERLAKTKTKKEEEMILEAEIMKQRTGRSLKQLFAESQSPQKQLMNTVIAQKNDAKELMEKTQNTLKVFSSKLNNVAGFIEAEDIRRVDEANSMMVKTANSLKTLTFELNVNNFHDFFVIKDEELSSKASVASMKTQHSLNKLIPILNTSGTIHDYLVNQDNLKKRAHQSYQKRTAESLVKAFMDR